MFYIRVLFACSERRFAGTPQRRERTFQQSNYGALFAGCDS
jgi:hypothetical protein